MRFRSDSQRKAVMSKLNGGSLGSRQPPSEANNWNGWGREQGQRFERLDEIDRLQKTNINNSDYEKLEKEKCKLIGIPYKSPLRRAYSETARRVIP